MTASYRVALVVDQLFGAQVEKLSRSTYVWLVQSSDNNHWAEQVWRHAAVHDDPLMRGLSTFEWLDGESIEDMIIRMLDVIDEHHGDFAHDPAWSEIEVVASRIKASALEYGEVRCEHTPNGFLLSRA